MNKNRKLINALLVSTMMLSGLALDVSAADGDSVKRLGGDNRIDTSIVVSNEAYANGSKTVVLAGWDGEVDALTGTLLASAKEAPLLIVSPGNLGKVKAQIAELNATDVILLGGKTVINESIENDLNKTYTVSRIGGDNRYETAAAVATEVAKLTDGEKDHVFITNDGWSGALADALTAGPVSGDKQMPILITGKDSLNKDSLAAIKSLKATKATIVGGKTVVSDKVKAELEAAGITVDRVGGDNRYETAVNVAKTYYGESKKAIIANNGYANGFADALVGGYFGAKEKAPVLFTSPASLSAQTANYLDEKAMFAYVLGGTDAVSYTALGEVETIIEGNKVVEDLTVKSVSAINGKTVEVKFNKAVNPTTVNTTNINLERTNGTDPTYTVKLDDSRKVATLDLSANYLKNVDENFVLTVKDVKDMDGNEITETSNVYNLSDKVRPTIGNVSFADTNTIEFAVSEDIDASTITASNIKVYAANGIEVTGLTPTHVPAKNKVTIDVSSITETGNYTLRAVGLKDLSTNLISPNPTQKTFTVSADKVAPKIASIKNLGTDGTDGFLEIKFDEKLQADPEGDSSIDYFNIKVDGTAATTPTVTTTDGKTFVVNTTDLVNEGLYNITIEDYKDLAGNAGASKSQYVTIKSLAPEVASVSYGTYASGNKVVVKFDRDVSADTIADIAATYITSDFVEANVTIDTSKITVTDIDNDGINELVIDADDYLTGSTGTALPGGKYTATLPASSVKDAAGQSNKAQKITFNVPEVPATSQVKVDSSSAPSQTGNEVTVKFTGTVDVATARNLDNYTIEGNKVFEKAVFTSTAKNEVKLTLKDDAIKESGDYILAINGVKDAKGNAVKAYSEEIALTETERPYMAKAEVTAKDTVVVTFNEILSGTVNAEDFNVTVNGKKLVKTTDYTVSTTGAVSTITLTNDLTDTSDVVVVETSAAFDGTDTAGNVGVKGQKITATWK